MFFYIYALTENLQVISWVLTIISLIVTFVVLVENHSGNIDSDQCWTILKWAGAILTICVTLLHLPSVEHILTIKKQFDPVPVVEIKQEGIENVEVIPTLLKRECNERMCKAN